MSSLNDRLISSMLGRKYQLGGYGLVSGEAFDCLGLIVEFTREQYRKDLFYDIDCETQGLLEEYVEVYSTLPDYAMSMLLIFLSERLLKVNKAYMIPNDIVTASTSTGSAVGVYLGSGSLMVTTEKTGCISVGISDYVLENVYKVPQNFVGTKYLRGRRKKEEGN